MPDDFDENKVFPSKEEIRAEVLYEMESLEVPHSERVKTCIEANPVKLRKLVQFLEEQEKAELLLPPRIVDARDEKEAKAEFASAMKPAKVENMDRFLQDGFQTESEEEEESDLESDSDDDDTPKKKKKGKKKKKDKKRRSSTSTESLEMPASKKVKETKESKSKNKNNKKDPPRTNCQYSTSARKGG